MVPAGRPRNRDVVYAGLERNEDLAYIVEPFKTLLDNTTPVC
jgi:hypothetical protein